MGFDNYLMTVRKLNNMGRWATENMLQRTTVSEHSFFVAQIGQLLGIIEEKHGNKIDWRNLYARLLNHDVTEALTGDIISTTKHKNPEIKRMVTAIEHELAEEYMIKILDDEYKEDFRKILFLDKDDTLEGTILKYADLIDALIECIKEIQLHNYIPFENKYYSMVEMLKSSKLISVKYLARTN